MARKRLPGILPGTMTDFTILVVGFDRENFCAVIESIYVPEALNQTEAGWMAAEGYEVRTGIVVQPLYAAPGRVHLEKLAADDVVI
jgi:hypothetical protein